MYIVTNQKEISGTLTFKTGLNIDPIYDYRNRKENKDFGIIFAKDDILGLIDKGPWIRTVSLPDDALCHQVSETPPIKYQASKAVLSERQRITAGMVRDLIVEGYRVHTPAVMMLVKDTKKRLQALPSLYSHPFGLEDLDIFRGYLVVVECLLAYLDGGMQGKALWMLAKELSRDFDPMLDKLFDFSAAQKEKR